MVDRLFADRLPALPNESDTVSETLGTVIDIAVSGWVTHLWAYGAQFEDATIPMRLYRETSPAAAGTLVASGTISSPTASAWNSVALGGAAGGVAVTAGRYVVARYARKWAATSDFFASSSYAAGNLTAPAAAQAGGKNGRFNSSADVFPTSSFRDTFYFTDISFTTEDPAGGGTVDPEPEPARQAQGWWTYGVIVQEAAEIAAAERTAAPVACPHDGEPLRTGPDGALYCPFDGWRP